jgi:3-methylfumaryl-CoA hydratase
MSAIVAGAEIPSQKFEPSAVDLFMFSASAWLLHRIHYDRLFTTEHDGHPDLLIHGPLQGVYLVRTAESWLGERARLQTISYRHLTPAYLGDALECGGAVLASDEDGVDLELFAKNQVGDVITTGKARMTWR